MKRINRPWLIIILLLTLPLMQLSCVRRNANIYPLDSAYYREASLLKAMQAIQKKNPDQVALHQIGTSANNKKPIYALQIQSGLDRIPILIVGQHHGDEVIGIQIVMEFARKMTSTVDYLGVKQLLDKYSFWIIPTLNPEGWDVVSSGKYEWKRKNNTDTNNNGVRDYPTDGIDLNRNYPTFWVDDPPLTEDNLFYKGKSPATENEIKAIIELAATVKFKYMFSYHSSYTGIYSEKIYLPWKDKSDSKVIDDFEQMLDIAQVYASATKKDYADEHYKVHTGSSSKLGNSRNYFYYTWGTYAYDIEVAGVNKYGVSVVHPKASLMTKTVTTNVNALIKALTYTSKELSAPESNPAFAPE